MDSLFWKAASVVLTIFIVVYTYFKWKFTYWKSKNFPHKEPTFPVGNLPNPLTRKENLTFFVGDYYNEMKSKGHRHCGMYLFGRPTYIPMDPQYVKNIMQKDFDHFVNHGNYINEVGDPLSAHLFSLEDEKWRNLRIKLTPTFTSGKMKMMFQTLTDCSGPFMEQLNLLHDKQETVDIKEMVARFTTDIIGSCAFGLECNSFKDENAEFRKYGKKFFEPDTLQKLKLVFMMAIPEFCKKMNMVFTPPDITKFFMGIVKDTMDYRTKENITRKDFMQLLIDMRDSMTFNEIAAQAFVFFLGGFETSSTTMTFAFYELAKNPEIQGKLRKDIDETLLKHNGRITYESLKEMKYLEQVLDETLRKYPPLPVLTRVCTKDYKLPDSDAIIEKGVLVFIPAYAIHHDPEFYPDPQKFDPDRFSAENKSKREPFTYMPFGEGPRICIGLRFGLMQAKVGMVSVLKNFNIKLRSPKSMAFDKDSFILTSAEAVCLDIERIKS